MSAKVPNHLKHFKEFQDQYLDQACAELQTGQKVGHWVWGMWPMPEGLADSRQSKMYAITSPDHAREYLDCSPLKKNLERSIESARTGAEKKEGFLQTVVGETDYKKLHACLTVFAQADPYNNVFKKALKDFYFGELDEGTVAWLVEKGSER